LAGIFRHIVPQGRPELMIVGISRDNNKRVDIVDGDALARRRN
jgi:hypothetical protein